MTTTEHRTTVPGSAEHRMTALGATEHRTAAPDTAKHQTAALGTAEHPTTAPGPLGPAKHGMVAAGTAEHRMAVPGSAEHQTTVSGSTEHHSFGSGSLGRVERRAMVSGSTEHHSFGSGSLGRVEHVLTALAGRYGALALRVTLALTFVWFGALKVTNDTPVGDFVAGTVSWIPGVSGAWFVPFLGVVEVLLGVALLVGRGLRVVLPLLFAHLVGTFLSLVTQPEVTFQGGNPVMLTTEGEFVVKNLILLSAVLVLYGLQRARGRS